MGRGRDGHGYGAVTATPRVLAPSGIITLTTDFGLEDAYVAEMKAVLLSIAPHARLVDVSHRVAAQDVEAAAYLVQRSARWFPDGTVHLAVVDPGVGTDRRALVVRTGVHFLVGPDNGLFEPFLASEEAVEIREIREARYRLESGTAVFEGRDRFAPAAAFLAAGVDPSVFGPEVDDPVRGRWPEPRSGADGLEGEVIYVDAFGSLVTNIPSELAVEGATVVLETRDIGPVRRAYAEAEREAPIAVAGSGGTIEIAVREGRADVRLSAGRRSRVRLVRPEV
jgi:S-adenosylmethionine hydrolase